MNKFNSLSYVACLGLLLLSFGCTNETTVGSKEAETEAGSPAASVEQITKEPLSESASAASKDLLASDKATALFFYADWCPVCKSFKPTIESVKEDYDEMVEVVYLNTDEKKDLTEAFEIKSIPTLFLFDKTGNFVEMITGSLPADKLGQQFDMLTKAEMADSSDEESMMGDDKKKEQSSEQKTT